MFVLSNLAGRLEIERYIKRNFSELIDFPDVFERAKEFFVARKVISKDMFEKLTAEMKRRAFTVGRDADKTVIGLINEKLNASLADGISIEDFITDIDMAFDTLGLTALQPYHLNTVFMSNILTAAGEGRKQVVDELDAEEFPFRQVVAVDDSRTRDSHRLINGFTARKDDPVWDWLKTPFSYNCRCGIWPVHKSEGATESAPLPELRGEKGFEFL